MNCCMSTKTDELKKIHDGNQSQMEKLRLNVQELLKAFDDAKQMEL